MNTELLSHQAPDFAAAKRGALQIEPVLTPPLTVLTDRLWCFESPVKLSVDENPVTHQLKIGDLVTQQTLFVVERAESTRSQLVFVVDAETKETVMTVDASGFPGQLEVFKGSHVQGKVRAVGLATASVTRTNATIKSRDSSDLVAFGGWLERVATLHVQGGTSWHPAVRLNLNQPEHGPLHVPYATVEVSAGVDVTLAVVFYLCRQVSRDLRTQQFRQSWMWSQLSLEP